METCKSVWHFLYDTMREFRVLEGQVLNYFLIFRVCVSKVSTLTVAVYYCDYGEVEIVEPLCLRRLESDFCKVPFMAIKGKLYGNH